MEAFGGRGCPARSRKTGERISLGAMGHGMRGPRTRQQHLFVALISVSALSMTLSFSASARHLSDPAQILYPHEALRYERYPLYF